MRTTAHQHLLPAPAGRSAFVVVPATTTRHADLLQAQYFHRLLEGQRHTAQGELSTHQATLASCRRDGDLPDVKRLHRLVRLKETELAEIGRLIGALVPDFRYRRPTSPPSRHTTLMGSR